MKPYRETLYGYSCYECRNEVWLMSAPEKFIYCPFCGSDVNDLQCKRVFDIRVLKEKDYRSGD
jgi:DNA-directed RNA polymerase subunit RPC12/RpoP